MKTIEEVEELKRQWKSDPIWDIEETEGFEDHRNELYEFRLRCENQWSRDRQVDLAEKAEALGAPGNKQLTAYIEQLERRISGLENKVDRLLQ